MRLRLGRLVGRDGGVAEEAIEEAAQRGAAAALTQPAPAVVHSGLVGEHGEQYEALAVLEGDGEEQHLHEAAGELVTREQRRLCRGCAVGTVRAVSASAASMAWARCVAD